VKRFLAHLVILAALALPQPGLTQDRIIEGGPQTLADTRSLGDVIRAATAPVHVSFVHGMRAEGPGASAAFRSGLLRRFRGSGSGDPVRRFLDLGERPDAAIGGRRIWATDPDWAASRPFVDRYTLRLAGGAVVVVDEVNWWPLLFPIKCRFIVLPEHDLSGDDEEHLRLCAGHAPAPNRALYHPWLTDEELRRALDTPSRSGGGASANAMLKREILNWGLADAVIALGPMRQYLHRAMQDAFEIAVEGQVAGRAQDHILIAESLGSFVVLDALNSHAPAVGDYLERTRDIYFFANQFALLELARIADAPNASRRAPGPQSPLGQLEALGEVSAAAPRHRQIIALSDPSDLLTYRVPEIRGTIVVNVYIRNARRIFGLANPMRAHTGHADNPTVWDVLLAPRDGE